MERIWSMRIGIANASVDHHKKAIYIKVSISNIKSGLNIDEQAQNGGKSETHRFACEEKRRGNQLVNICVQNCNFPVDRQSLINALRHRWLEFNETAIKQI